MLKKRCQNFLATLASSEFWLLILVTHPVARSSHEFTQNSFTTPLRLISRLASCEMPKNSFLKSFSWETCFKPLPYSLKPLFQYFYIKTQSIWMVFHSINISKVILNSFLWFWSWDYVLEGFCALGSDFHHKGWENLFFCQIFIWDWFLLMICFECWPLVAKRTCIKGVFYDVHPLFYIVVHSIHVRCLIKCLLGIFSLVWTLMSTKLWGFSCFLIRNMFGSLVMYLAHLAPHVLSPCFGHALHIATSCTHLYYPCHALVYTLSLHSSIS